MATRCKKGETVDEARARQALKMRSWRAKNAEHHRLWRRKYTEKNREQLSEYERQRANRRYKESPEFRKASLARINRWKEKVGSDYLNKQAHDRHRELKIELITAYGGKCVCCGDAHFDFLTVHHIARNGAAHRRELKGNSFYKWLKKRGFPKDNFELNCWNCNLGKEANNGICPHEQERNGIPGQFRALAGEAVHRNRLWRGLDAFCSREGLRRVPHDRAA